MVLTHPVSSQYLDLNVLLLQILLSPPPQPPPQSHTSLSARHPPRLFGMATPILDEHRNVDVKTFL